MTGIGSERRKLYEEETQEKERSRWRPRELWWRGSVMASDMQHQDPDHASEMKDKNCSYANRASMELMRKGGGSGIKGWGVAVQLTTLLATTAHVIWPRSIHGSPSPAAGRRRMTVIIHSLADAALADGPRRHPLTRSPSSVALPPISTLIPAASLPTRASKSSPPKLSLRDQTLLSQSSLKGWSSDTFSSNDTSAPLMLPGTHIVHRPMEVSNVLA